MSLEVGLLLAVSLIFALPTLGAISFVMELAQRMFER